MEIFRIWSRKIPVFFFAVIFAVQFFFPLLCKANEFTEHSGEYYSTVYDREGNYIFCTGRSVSEGDRYISEDNIEYHIENVEDDKAYAREIGEVDLLEGLEEFLTGMPIELAANNQKMVAIFHTHNGESYEPGPESTEGKGDIHQIGESLQNALESEGIRAIHREDLHLPHDGLAYERSRATVVEVLKENPDIILDIHRDGVPHIQEYLREIDGQEVTQIRLVVGRQNPNFQANDQFARVLKASADEIYPGLIKDIFYGRGNYNQQMAPNFLLLEFGTYVNTADQANSSAYLMAAPIKRVLQGDMEALKSDRPVWNTILIILLVVTAGITGYLYINEGSWEGVFARLRELLPVGIFGRKGD